MARQLLLLGLWCAGCFPYRETYRPTLDGVVTDERGAPAAGVRVESCSATHWDPRCRYRANTSSDAQGRFHFTQEKEWTWCCFGEAPLPHTLFAACGSDGRVGFGRVESRAPPEPLKLVLGRTPADSNWGKQACR
jgi:hypothetical protein